MSDDKRIPEITSEELQSAISKLKTGKSPDGNGIRAEDIKDCNDETREMMRQIFNEIIKRNNFTPDEWKKVKIKVIRKKGDVEDVSNYRPICSLPAMYKLFSTILYGRFFPMLDQNQAEDQAGFRKTYQTTDHFATYRMMEQKCQEWRINQNVDCDGGLNSDSVFCLGKMSASSQATQRWKGQLTDVGSIIKNCSMLMENQLSSSGIFSQNFRHWEFFRRFRVICEAGILNLRILGVE